MPEVGARPPGQTIREREQQRVHLQGIRCEVSGCLLPVRRIGSYCKRHDRNRGRTGDPRAPFNIPGKRFRTYEKLVDDFLVIHEDHQGLKNAIAFLDQLIQRGEVKTPEERNRGGRRQNLWKAASAAVHLLGLMNQTGVNGRDLLVRLLAARAMVLREPRAFLSDDHFVHQTMHHVIRAIPVRHVPTQRDKSVLNARKDRAGFGARKVLAETILPKLNLLLHRAAKALIEHAEIEQERQKEEQRVCGEKHPFSTNYTSADVKLKKAAKDRFYRFGIRGFDLFAAWIRKGHGRRPDGTLKTGYQLAKEDFDIDRFTLANWVKEIQRRPDDFGINDLPTERTEQHG